MRRVAYGVGTIIALGALTWLWVGTRSVDEAAHERFDVTLRELRRLDRTLDADVLRARFQLLNTYDPLVRTSAGITEERAELHMVPAFLSDADRATLEQEIAAYDRVLDESSRLVEDFKSRNAVLKNSLRYLPVVAIELADEADTTEDGRVMSTRIRTLLNRVLVYNLTSDETLRPQIDERLGILESGRADYPPALAGERLDLLVAHVRMILASKPEVDGIVRALHDLPMATAEDRVANAYTTGYSHAEHRARGYRTALYALSILLLLAVAGAFVQLRRALGQLAEANATLEQRVDERTRELSSRNREILALLDNVPQGIFTFGPDLRVQGRHSAALASVLGTSDLADRDVMELLFDRSDASAQSRAMHDMVLRCGFGLDPFMAELNWEHLVRRCRISGADGESDRSLEIDWASIVDDDGCVVRILASVKDVTALRALEAELAASSWQAKTIDQVLEVGIDAFHRFCGDALSRLDACEPRVRGERLAHADIDAVFAHLHTLKGNGRVLGLAQLATAIHAAEEPFAAARAAEDPSIDGEPLHASLATLRREIESTQSLVRRKLTALVSASDARTDAVARTVGEELARWQVDGADPAQCLDRIARVTRGERPCTVESVISDARRVFSVVSPELGKPAPSVVVRGDAPLDRPYANALGDALGHVFRNALAHGVERPEERRAAGKPAEGVVEIVVRTLADGLRISVRDDGRGLDMAALRARLGADQSDDALAESIFASGVSTAAQVTQISGRGIGMSAVRSSIAALDGTVGVSFTGAEHDGRRAFELVVELPRPRMARAA